MDPEFAAAVVSFAGKRVIWPKDATRAKTKRDQKANQEEDPRAVRLDFTKGRRSESSGSKSRKSGKSSERRQSGEKKERPTRKDDRSPSASKNSHSRDDNDSMRSSKS